jgi:hypothetical protein
MKNLLKSYIGNTVSVLSAAKKVTGVLMFVGEDYIVIEIAPEVIDIIDIDHIVALEGLKYDTFLAAIGRDRTAMNNDMLVRAEQLAGQAR